jgi:hypothetical protein
MTREVDTDRIGMDYRSFSLDRARPELCRDACTRSRTCKAYTYVKPGVQGKKARCWLKKGVPRAKKSSCCVSGVKRSAGPPGSASWGISSKNGIGNMNGGKGLRPSGGLPMPPRQLRRGAACVGALLSLAWESPGDRITQCVDAHGTFGPTRPSELDPIQVGSRPGDCGVSTTSSGSSESWWPTTLEDRLEQAHEGKNHGSSQEERDNWDGVLFALSTGQQATELGNGHYAVTSPATGETLVVQNGNVTNLDQTVEGGEGTTGEAGAQATAEQEQEKEKKQSKEPTSGPDDGTSRPTEPGSGGCDGGEAMAHSKKVFDCIMGGNQVAGAVGPGPVVNPMGGSMGMPGECNGVDLAQFWGSSTGDGVTDPSDDDTGVRGGPTTLDDLIRATLGHGGAWDPMGKL